MMDFVADLGRCCAAQEELNESESCDEHLGSLLSLSEESLDEIMEQDLGGDVLMCEYREAPPLFKAIEQENWKGILFFLSTGRWSTSALTSSYTHLEDPVPEHQVRTWVKCTGPDGETQWRQLPLHAAISYQAPLPVIQKIIEMYHDAILCRDDTGNLPLHLAFGFGSPDNVVAYLIKEYPQALSVRGLQRRRPVDCCDLGSNKARGEIIKACQNQTRASMVKEWDRHWKRSLVEAKRKSNLEENYALTPKTLEEVFDELVQLKIELKKTKELAKNRPTMIITKTEPLPPAPRRSVMKAPSEISKVFSFGKKSIRRSMKARGSSFRNLVSSASGTFTPQVAPSSKCSI